MTKRRRDAADVQKKKLQQQAARMRSLAWGKPMCTTSSRVLGCVPAAVMQNKKPQTQTTGISGPSSTQPMITASDPSFTASNSGSSHDWAASEKAFLDSIELPDPFRPEPTENDVVNNSPWLAAMCPNLFAKYNKGSEKTLTQAFLDMLKAEIARHPPLPPDYDSDAEWDNYGGGCRDESHLANEEFDWDSFRSTIVPPPPKK
ncbi:unnamed protein product [Linum trigynum]|uniref:Uncharacterized protein n=1 Tax=Linum trigynum TaxID=586398 RepID=A0AAV2F2W5_9ROSI